MSFLPDANPLLPLPPVTFHILLALSDIDRHGYGILQDVAARTNGELRLGAGTLYRSIQRMLEQGLIIETADRPVAELDDERRRYYRITPFGQEVARAEARRLVGLVELARVRGFVAGGA
jgi:DNA-binding PadR family transcriptional regulator